MIDPVFEKQYPKFKDWLNEPFDDDDDRDMADLGLKQGAPDEAIKAYKAYRKHEQALAAADIKV
jgi:hypothetical protein